MLSEHGAWHKGSRCQYELGMTQRSLLPPPKVQLPWAGGGLERESGQAGRPEGPDPMPTSSRVAPFRAAAFVTEHLAGASTNK